MRSRWTWLAAVAAAVAGLVAGCDGDGGGASSPQAFCERAFQVSEETCGVPETRGGGMELCVNGEPMGSSGSADMMCAMLAATLGESERAGRSRWNAEGAAELLAQLESGALCDPQAEAPFEPARILTPLVAEGGDCDQGYECAGAELRCLGGKCAPRAAEGGECDFDDDDCRSDLVCDWDTCRARLAEGDECSSSTLCPQACIAGRCAPLATAGQACDPGDHDDCAQPLYCTPEGCAAGGAAGASCDADHPCGSGLYCDGTCRERLTVGGECTEDGQCRTCLDCQDGVCTR